MRALLLALLLPTVASATAFRNPFNPTQCTWSGGCYVTAYFDLNRATGAVRDWACGTHTYDNHAGVDMGVGGFTGMNQGRDVLAAADGVVIGAHDGEFDQCTSGACGAANYVWLRHPDGKVTLYYHLRKNSVTVAVGQTVTCGQKLGQVGSSGYSTGPHLHFQVNTAQGDPNSFDDPFAGTTANCGGSISWWVAQGGYKSLPAYACETKPLPDVTVTEVTLSPAAPKYGDAVEFSAVVANVGNAGTGASVGVAFFVNGANVTFGIVPAMAAGASATITGQAKWTAVSGTHAIQAFADDVDRFAEANENNNKKTVSVVVAERPELHVEAISVTPAELLDGNEVTFSALVKNSGGATGSALDVRFEVDGVVIADVSEAALAAGASATVVATWTAKVGASQVKVTVDPAQKISEPDEANNSLERPLTVLALDADGDGYRADVDCNDAASAVNPGATEVCNGVDDDCDGAVDEGLDCSPRLPPDAATEAETSPEPDGLAAAEGGVGCGATAMGPFAVFAPLLLMRAFRRRRGSRA